MARVSRGVSVSQLTHELHAWVIKLTERGEFEGQQAARTVFDLYCHHTAANDDPRGEYERGEVLSGVVHPPVVARKTGLDVRTVRRANDWLHEQGFIWITDDETASTYRRIRSVSVMTIDEDSERRRKKVAGKITRPKPDRAVAKRRPRHLALVQEIGSHAR